MDSDAVRGWLTRKLPGVDEPIVDHLVYIILEDQTHWTASSVVQEEIGDLLLDYDTVDTLAQAQTICKKMWKDLSMAKLEAAVMAAAGNALGESKASARRVRKQDVEWVNCSDSKQLHRGMKIKALYKADNEFYDATFLEPARRSRYRVLFDGYGNEELVTLTSIKVRVGGKETKEDGPKQLKNAVRMSELEENVVKIKTTKKTLDFKQREAQRKLWEDTLRKKEAKEKLKYERLLKEEEKRIVEAAKRREDAFKMYMKARATGGRSTEVRIDNFFMSSDGETGEELISDSTVHFVQGHKYGLVGRNGSGKTTLLKRIADYQIDKFPLHLNISIVQQEIVGNDVNVVDTVVASDMERNILMEEEAKINAAIDNGTCTDAMEERAVAIAERLNDMGAYAADSRAAGILSGLGFDHRMQNQSTKELSGGWRMRVALAQALFLEPDILLLDEPTNHLDFPAVIWLEQYLIKYKKCVIIVSHDRVFLNNIITEVIHLDHKKLVYYKGNYDQFEDTRAKAREQQHKLYLQNDAKRAHIQQFVDKFRCNANRAKLVQSRIKALARIGMADDIDSDPIFQFAFPVPGPLQHDNIVEGYNVTFGYFPDQLLLKDVNFNINLQSRIGVLGANGVGKSTLINLIMDKLKPLDGDIKTNNAAKIATFSQHHVESLVMHLSPLDMLMKLFPDNNAQQIQSHLGRFGIVPPMSYQSIGTLSGGQKSRVSFAIITKQKPHLIIMDEPTNHLDLETIEALIMAINGYEGAVMCVSHDQYFLRNIGQEYWAVAGGRMTRYRTFKQAKAGAY